PPSRVRNLRAYWSSVMPYKATLTWTNPTTRTDDTPLAAEDIDHVDIFDNSAKIATVQGGSTNRFETDNLSAGPHTFTLLVVDKLGQSSASSNVAGVVVPSAPPKAVTDLNVELGTV